MTKEQIPIKSVVDLLGQLYVLAKEYPQFSGVAACHDTDADIQATVGNGHDKKTFVFINDDPNVMKLLVRELDGHRCLAGDSIDARAVIRRVERGKVSNRRMKVWISFAGRLVVTCALAAATALFFCSSVSGNLTDRVLKLESDVRMLQQRQSSRTEAPVPAESQATAKPAGE